MTFTPIPNGTIQQGQSVTSNSNILNTRTMLVGNVEGTTSNWTNLQCTNQGYLQTSNQDPKSSFGEITTIEPTPVAQIDFIYGINIFNTVTSYINSGTGTTTNSILLLSTGTTTNSSSKLGSKRYVSYRAGQGCIGRFTAMFNTGLTGTLQYAGVGTSTLNNGYFFGYNGTMFGIFFIKAGSSTFISQATWNVDVCDGSSSVYNPSGFNLTPVNGNVYQIKWQYLGFGNIFFFIENSQTGTFMLVHQIKYANNNVGINILQPNLALQWYVSNGSTSSNIVLGAGSGALFIEGYQKFLGPKFGQISNKSVTASAVVPMISLMNCTLYNGVNNASQIRLRTISAGMTNDSNSQTIFTLNVYLNATLTTPTFVAINGTLSGNGTTITNGNSIASYDTTSTIISGGTIIFSTVGANSFYIDVSDLDIYLSPTDELTFVLTPTAAAAASVAITWNEDL